MADYSEVNSFPFHSLPEQLRFNLNVSPNPSNMTTRFKLKPTPVILHKVKETNDGTNSPPLLSFNDKMELASRLARRELENNLLAYKSVQNSHLDYNEPSHKPHPPVTTATSHPPVTTATTPHPPVTKTTTLTRPHPPVTKATNCQITSTKARPRTVSFNEPPNKSGRGVTMTTAEDSGIELCSENDDSVINVRRLSQELALKLRVLPLPHHHHQHDTGVSTGEEEKSSSRLGWISELDKERKRESRRQDEQTIRNTRLLYQLQQKIKSAQRAINKVSSEESHTNKKYTYAIQQLATAQRTAIRTLSSLTITDTKIINELVTLLDLLSHLSTQCSPKEEGEELILAVHQLKEALSQHYEMSQLVKRNETSGSDVKVMKKKKKKLTPKLRGVLLSRYNQRPHPPINKFRPPITHKPHPPMTHKPRLPLVNKLPHFAVPTLSSSHKHITDLTSPKRKVKTTPLVTTPTCKTSFVNSSITQAPPTQTTPIINSDKLSKLQQEVTRQGWLSAQVSSHVQSYQEETDIKLKQLEDIVTSMNKPHPHLRSEPRPQTNKPTVRDEEESSIEKSSQESSEEEKTTHSEDNNNNNDDRIYYEKMVTRLNEIQKEKDEIQQKWSGNIVYNDYPSNVETTSIPPHSSLSHSHLHSHPHSHPHSPLSHSHPHSYPHSPSPLPLSTGTIERIMNYRQRYNNYLKLTGANIENGFDPWSLIENICDQLMDELLTETAHDIENTLDECVNQLYDEEFYKP